LESFKSIPVYLYRVYLNVKNANLICISDFSKENFFCLKIGFRLVFKQKNIDLFVYLEKFKFTIEKLLQHNKLLLLAHKNKQHYLS